MCANIYMYPYLLSNAFTFCQLFFVLALYTLLHSLRYMYCGHIRYCGHTLRILKLFSHPVFHGLDTLTLLGEVAVGSLCI